jgi:hypothetical protein
MVFWIPFVALILIVMGACSGALLGNGFAQFLERCVIALMAFSAVAGLAIWKWHGSRGRIEPAAWIALVAVLAFALWEERHRREAI